MNPMIRNTQNRVHKIGSFTKSFHPHDSKFDIGICQEFFCFFDLGKPQRTPPKRPGGTRAGLRAEQRVTQGAERGTVWHAVEMTGETMGNQGG